MSKKLFVGNLPFDVNDADLTTVVGVAGSVASAKIVINKKTGRSKGYGFVEMETEAAAEEAVKKFEGATLNERPLTVQLATPKQEAQASTDEAGGESTTPAKIAIITPNASSTALVQTSASDSDAAPASNAETPAAASDTTSA